MKGRPRRLLHLNWSQPVRSGARARLHRSAIGVDVERARRSLHHFARDNHFFDPFQPWKIEHGLKQDAFENRTQAPSAGLSLDRFARNRAERFVGKGQFDVFHLEQPLVLFHERVLRIGEDFLQRGLVEILQRRDDREAAHELRDQAILQQILWLHVTEDFTGAAILRRKHLSRKPDRRRTPARGDDLLQPRERAATDEEDVGGVDLQELLLRMLAATLRRNRCHGAFHDLQQGLLHALAGHVAGDGGIVRLAADLVDFVDVDDASLRPLDIVVGGLQQLENDVFHVLADITGFGQRRGVRHRERYVENPRQGLRQQRLARTGRTDQQDVRFRKLNVVVLGLVIQTLVVIMDGDREHLLRVTLADHVVVQDLADFLGGRNAVARLHKRGFVFLANDIHAQLDAFVADEYGRARDQLADFVLALATERAIQRVLGVARADLTHPCLRPPFDPVCSIVLFRYVPADGGDRAKSVPKKPWTQDGS